MSDEINWNNFVNVDTVRKQLPLNFFTSNKWIVMSNDVRFELFFRNGFFTVSPSGGVGRKYMFQIDIPNIPIQTSNTFVAPNPGTMNIRCPPAYFCYMTFTIKMEKVSEEKILKISNCNLSKDFGTLVKISNCNLIKDFGTLLNTKKLSDVTIVTSDGHKIPAHKVILSARSHVFAAMFDHDMLENQMNSVNIEDFNQKVIMEMLRYLYTGEVLCLKDIAIDLVVAADKYQLDSLKPMCLLSLGSNLSIETAATVLKLADLYEDNVLKLKSVQFIKENAESVARTSNWKSLNSTDKELIMKEFLQPKDLIPIDAKGAENTKN